MLKKFKSNISNIWVSIKPRYYKRTLFFGKKEFIRFTSKGIGKFFYKLIWILIVTIMLITMILGGLAMTQTQNQTIQIPVIQAQ